MKPGQELDRLIAEMVMGWKSSKKEGWPDGEYYPDYYGGGPYRITGTAADRIDVEAFHPSTNIAHAWEVVERLAKLRHDVTVGTNGNGYQCAVCVVTACEPLVYVGIADTAPHAICLAALKAMGVEV